MTDKNDPPNDRRLDFRVPEAVRTAWLMFVAARDSHGNSEAIDALKLWMAIPADVLERLREAARAEGRPLEAVVAEILTVAPTKRSRRS